MKKINIPIRHIFYKFEPYAMKVARTVLGGGNFSNKTTYLDRPFAALLLVVIGYSIVNYKVTVKVHMKYLY